ncbi:AI-2E family transporter [Leuconostocaceae bacterium ESL0958]|nr:AI-2E family transporter [Leuconostocaceae bacterium ESL0958]
MARPDKAKEALWGSTKMIRGLVAWVLLFLAIWLFYQIRFVFEPLKSLVAAVGLPVIIAGVFYYLLKPLLNWLEKKTGWNRRVLALGLLILVFGLIVLAVVVLSRILFDQLSALVERWPSYLAAAEDFIKNSLKDEQYESLRQTLLASNDQINETALNWVKANLAGSLLGVGQIAAKSVETLSVLIASPFILYYLLVDGSHLPEFIVDKLPFKARQSTATVLHEMSAQIAKYVRGQIGVATAVMIMFAIGYTIIGLPSGLLLAILAGVLNMIPYLGSFLAQLPVYSVALITGGPRMALLVTLVLIVEQPLEGHLITPKILGDALAIHPVTVIIALLASGKMFGLVGFILAIPGYAVLKVLVTHAYAWWRQNSALFAEEEEKL